MLLTAREAMVGVGAGGRALWAVARRGGEAFRDEGLRCGCEGAGRRPPHWPSLPPAACLKFGVKKNTATLLLPRPRPEPPPRLPPRARQPQQLQLMLFDTGNTGFLSELQLEQYFRSLIPECPLLQDIEVGVVAACWPAAQG